MSVFKDPPRRDKQILIRVTSDEKDQLEAEAEKLGITASELIRRAVNAYLSPKPKPKKKSGENRRKRD